MKSIAIITVIVFAGGAGAFIGPRLHVDGASPDLGAARGPDRAKVRAAAREAADELIAVREASRPKAALSAQEENEVTQAAEGRRADVDDVQADHAHIEKVVAMLERQAEKPIDPAERDIQYVTTELLKPLKRGEILVKSEEPAVRRQGVRALGLAAGSGDAGSESAFKLLNGLLTDGDDTVAREAARQIERLTTDAGEARLAMLKATGVEQTLVNLVGTVSGREQTQILDALVNLKNPAALPILREAFAKTPDRRGGTSRIETANALRRLGSDSEALQLVSESSAALAGADRRARSQAIDALGQLDHPDAKVVLQTALNADPNGREADRIRAALWSNENRDRRQQSTTGRPQRR